MTYKVIDVSVWQGNIDWQRVKADGVTGAIIRYADGHYLDRLFDQNMRGAMNAGLHVGAYIFSRALTSGEAYDEAERLIRACKPYTLSLPIYIDMEAPEQQGVAAVIVDSFLEVCDRDGVKGGIYANLNWFRNYINPYDHASRPLWIAQYNDRITHESPELFGMWQYTSDGTVAGINGRVDMNHCYVPYWEGVEVKPAPIMFGSEAPNRHVWGVADIQRWAVICNFGASLDDVDGFDGPVTKSFVERGQRTYGLPADGLFGPATQAKAEAQIKLYQSKLKEKGFYGGELDGIPGPLTFEAVGAFQNSKGLTPDRIIGPATQAVLMGGGPAPIEEAKELRHFSDDEFKCECGCGGDIKHELKVKIDEMRERLGEPIVVTSGFRCPAQNAKDGGVPDSLHMSGDACDCYSPGMSYEKLIKMRDIAQGLGLGTIIYPGLQFIHVQLYPRNQIIG